MVTHIPHPHTTSINDTVTHECGDYLLRGGMLNGCYGDCTSSGLKCRMVAIGVTICSLPVESAHMKWIITFFRYSRFSVSRDLCAWVGGL